MTDRNPDDLYDALRDRLADYGQEPPAALWAGIRAQLPPPVAPPQLRKRRRRAPVAWLFLVILTVAAVGAGWHRWGAKLSATSASRTSQKASRHSSANASHINATSPQSATAASRPNASAVALSQPAATQTSSAAAPRVAADAAAGPGGVPVAAPTNSAGAVATNESKTAATPASAATSAPAGVAVSASAKAAVVSSAAQAASGSPTGRPAGSVTGLATKELAANSSRENNASTRAARGQAQGLGKPAASVASATSHLPEAARSAVAIHGAARPGRNVSTAAITRSSTRSSQALAGTKKSPARHRRQPVAAMAAVATPATSQPQPSASTPPIAGQPTVQAAPATAAAGIAAAIESRRQRTAQALLPARTVAVQLAAKPGLPAPQPVAIAPSLLPLPFASRWAVQVVAGPALTYRSLNTTANATTPISTSPPYTFANGSANPVATLERPALGSAAQATVRRTLGSRWSLSAGLGYAEYASALALQQVHAATAGMVPNTPDSVATGIHRRDTYRFVTVPVRVGYGWTLSGRWRVGLLAGAEAAVYVGGSSTEGSPCACQSQTWSFANNPYRRLSLGASLGAEARYRLAGGRWELLAQPTATYLLTPLAPATSAYYQRHLFGGAALLGVAFNLP